MHLLSVRVDEPPAGSEDDFPFGVPLVRARSAIEFRSPVAILVGENGAGKSTLLEALAVAADLPAAGGHELARDPSLEAARRLERALRLSWSVRSRRGLFLRAEDFFGFSQRVERMRAEADDGLRELRDEHERTGRASVRKAMAPHASGLAALRRLYGDGLDARSHGEGFLAFFQARLAPGGLHLLDEPEAALSPLRQLALMSLLKESVARGSQFVLATHSPILMAFPGAQLLEVGDHGVREAAYDDLEHVRLMRDFLASPDAFVRRL